MPALELLRGWRVVADPEALDHARWTGSGLIVLRFAPDEAFAVNAEGVELADPHAIAEVDHGFVGAWLKHDDVPAVVAHLDWPMPGSPGVVGQGKIAGVPAKLWTLSPSASNGRDLDGAEVLLVTHAAYGHELADRLGWPG